MVNDDTKRYIEYLRTWVTLGKSIEGNMALALCDEAEKLGNENKRLRDGIREIAFCPMCRSSYGCSLILCEASNLAEKKMDMARELLGESEG